MNQIDRNCLIIHGCPDEEESLQAESRTYDKHWFPWIQAKLQGQGIQSQMPQMPTPWSPEYEKFKAEFEKYLVNEKTILIGHSCGCAFLVRWLGETKRKVAKLILVAPWKIPSTGDVGREAFYIYPIDPGIRSRVGEIVIFTSDNEEDDGKESTRIFHQALRGEVIELHGRGHYTEGDMNTTEFPELLDVVLR